jgi:hypothetical protein
MKPCDCKDNNDIYTLLNEQGVSFNGYSFSVAPMSVFVKTIDCELRLPQTVFKRFAEWYLEDQERK